MARKPKAFDIWKAMKPAALRRLAFAVFLMFGVLGPLTILMESALRPVTWTFVLLQTIGSGGMAATIVLFGRKRWWTTVLIVVFWSGVLAANSGGLSFVFEEEGFRVRLGNNISVSSRSGSASGITLNPAELDAIYTQRGVTGVLAIAMLGFGYAAFIRVIRAEVRQRARFETEIRIARDIQESLMPESSFRTPWLEVEGITIPASEVGGDFFDIIPLSGRRIAVAVADVTGHGVGAGMLSAMTKSAVHAHIGHDPSPSTLLEQVNRTVFDLSDKKTFVTFAYILLDADAGTARVATAGHPPLLLKRAADGTVVQVRTSGLALGIRPKAAYTEESVRFASGDIFLLYTDGVVEAMNGRREQYDEARLRSALAAAAGSSGAVCSSIIAGLRSFRESGTFTDDVTLVAARLS